MRLLLLSGVRSLIGHYKAVQRLFFARTGPLVFSQATIVSCRVSDTEFFEFAYNSLQKESRGNKKNPLNAFQPQGFQSQKRPVFVASFCGTLCFSGPQNVHASDFVPLLVCRMHFF